MVTIGVVVIRAERCIHMYLDGRHSSVRAWDFAADDDDNDDDAFTSFVVIVVAWKQKRRKTLDFHYLDSIQHGRLYRFAFKIDGVYKHLHKTLAL